MAEFAPKAQVREIVEMADIDQFLEKDIDENERIIAKELFKNAKKLHEIYRSDDIMKFNALNRAIEDIASEYEGLNPKEIKRWIREGAKRLPLPLPEAELGSRRFGKPPEKAKKDKLYGSIKESDIVDAMADQQKIEIKKEMVKIGDAIKTTGEHSVTLQLAEDVAVEVKVNIEAE